MMEKKVYYTICTILSCLTSLLMLTNTPYQPAYDALRYLQAGIHHLKNKNVEESSDYLMKALLMSSDDQTVKTAATQALFQLGCLLFDQKKYKKAMITFKHVATINNNCASALHNIGLIYAQHYGNYRESITWYRKALLHDEYNNMIELCLALSLLATGNLIEGFMLYESRFAADHHRHGFPTWPLAKQWDGNESINEKCIIVYTEQGIGDTLHFIRYAQLLKQRGARVMVKTEQPISELLSCCPYIDKVVSYADTIKDFDFQTPLMSLACLTKTTKETVPATIPYLYADQKLTNYWRQRLPVDKKFNIGICWQGSLMHRRSKYMPLDEFEKIAQIPNISLYSLQHEIDTQEIQSTTALSWLTFFHLPTGSLDQEHGRFMDTAAIIKNLDLVITVDTSIAHLAGGLGVPTWLILSCPAEWRWQEKNSYSIWYPTMRIFRQQKKESWHLVMEEICTALRAILNNHSL